ncbi:carbonic anhydrase [Roseiterribacter gracilis]|uniref:Carbonic anhydrase n=1 Tax=Roseiterribacter gracilis TaxID=2812848 RepID=A0A8S8XCT3_9PROT|nr:carbonic anhydrase [Rhodospirillales bacterium TMPK1]
MNFVETMLQRNAAFAADGFNASLKILPTQRTMIVGCVDPRVDPLDVLQLEPGETAIIRNVGGRVNPALLETMAILRTVSRVGGQEVGAGWNLVLLHHTDCGIVGCYHHAPGLVANYMGAAEEGLGEAFAITDPYRAVAIDVAALRANPRLPDALTVSGMVYDVATGKIELVVPPAPLRAV